MTLMEPCSTDNIAGIPHDQMERLEDPVSSFIKVSISFVT